MTEEIRGSRPSAEETKRSKCQQGPLYVCVWRVCVRLWEGSRAAPGVGLQPQQLMGPGTSNRKCQGSRDQILDLSGV